MHADTVPSSPVASRIAATTAFLVATTWWFGALGIDQRFVSFSDGVYGYLASLVARDGAVGLYTEHVSSLPPLLILAFAHVWQIDPSIPAQRAAIALVHVVGALLTFAVARRAGMSPWFASAASILATVMPIATLVRGLDGELLLTPLLLCVLLTLAGRRPWLTGALLGIGLLIKLTWIVFLVGGLLAVTARYGRRAGLAATVSSAATALLAMTLLTVAYGWAPTDLLNQLVMGQAGSGIQLLSFAQVSLIAVLMLWPLIALAAFGIRSLDGSARYLLTSGIVSLLFTVKQGTFFNVLEPLEPLLAIAAVFGAISLWRRPGHRAVSRSLVIFCAAAIALHTVTLASSSVSSLAPFPLGAAIYDLDNQHQVGVAVTAIQRSAAPDDQVMVNPYLALAAHRKLVGEQPDWFLLHALERTCSQHRSPTRAMHCDTWRQVKASARTKATVIGVDDNVKSFDPGFRADTLGDSMVETAAISKPPLVTRIFVRAPRR